MVKTEAEAEKVLSSLQAVLNQFLKTNVSLELLGYIPQDATVSRAIQEQRPLMLAYPNSRAATSIDTIARRLVIGGTTVQPAGIGGVFQRMAKLVRRKSRV